MPRLYEALVGQSASVLIFITYLEQTEELLDRARFRLTAAAATGLPPPPGYPTGVVTAAAAAGAAVAGMRIMRRKRCCVCRATRFAVAAAAMPSVGRKEGRKAGQWWPPRRISEVD